MRLAIMQPYFFPYLGYFQLIHSVDTFVVYDDVNFIKGGWINRNFMLSQGEKSRFTLELSGASPNVCINEIAVGKNRRRLLKTISQNYAKAPKFDNVMPLIEEIVMFGDDNLARYVDHSLRKICHYLSLSPKWIISSSLKKDNNLRGQEKVLSICCKLGAKTYVNLPGGRDLYDQDDFKERGINLSFLESEVSEYQQFGSSFVPNLSILDVMMFNDLEECGTLLAGYAIG